MPTYEYRCKDCEGSFEIVQSFADNTLTKCPGKRAGGPLTEQCTTPGKGKVVKVFASVGIAFKGDGFYKNDHGTKKPAASSESSSSSSDAPSADSSSDSSATATSSDSSTADAKPEKKKKTEKATSAKAK